MASSGGNETVGRRGGAQQRGGSGRDNSSDLSSSTSKKKQKDRANQESREAKRAAAAADGVIAEVKKGKKDQISCATHRIFVIDEFENYLYLHCRLDTLIYYEIDMHYANMGVHFTIILWFTHLFDNF